MLSNLPTVAGILLTYCNMYSDLPTVICTVTYLLYYVRMSLCVTIAHSY